MVVLPLLQEGVPAEAVARVLQSETSGRAEHAYRPYVVPCAVFARRAGQWGVRFGHANDASGPLHSYRPGSGFVHPLPTRATQSSAFSVTLRGGAGTIEVKLF